MTALDQISGPVVLVPAYGRKYLTSEAARQDWRDGKDFQVVNGPYCSVRDLKHMTCSSVWIDLITTMLRVE